jgi:glycosyltransferase involved in cell wall biosynthesis
MMRIAFVTDELPKPGSAGHLAFNHALIAWLRAQGHEVTILSVRARLRRPVEKYDFGPVAGRGLVAWRGRVFTGSLRGLAGILSRMTVGLLPATWSTALRRRGRASAYGVVDTVLGAFVSPEQTAWCAARLAREKPDAVLVDTVFRAPILAHPALLGLRSVIVAHDVFYLRHLALMSAGYRVHPSVFSREMETRLLDLAGAVAAIQPEEAETIRRMCPDKKIFSAPMPALPCPRIPGTDRLTDRLVFVGSDSLPNLDGLRWFLADIWPRLRAWRGTLTLDLIGTCGRALPNLPEGVNRLGVVKNLAPYLHRASLAISPLRAGSGLKIKVLDYARHGLVTVATPASLQGFAQDAEAPFIAAADAVAFSNAIAAQLRTNRPGAAERRALEYVTRHYGLERSFAGFTEALNLAPKDKVGSLG